MSTRSAIEFPKNHFSSPPPSAHALSSVVPLRNPAELGRRTTTPETRAPPECVERSYKTGSAVGIKDRADQISEQAVGASCVKYVGSPQVTHFERTAQALRRLLRYAAAYTLEQNPVVRPRNAGKRRKSDSSLYGRD